MSNNFALQDVSLSAVLHISRMINVSHKPLSKEDIVKGLDGICGQSYVTRGLSIAEQLDFVESVGDKTYKSSGKFQDEFSKIQVNDFPILARKALQSYPPFVLYLENLKIGYNSDESSKISAGIFNLDEDIAKKFFPSCAIYCEVLSKDRKTLNIKTESQVDYLRNMHDSLNNEFHATSLIVTLLSNEVYSYFSTKGMDFTRAAKALVEIRRDPKDSLFKIFEFFESCLFAFGNDIGANVQQTNGVSQLIQELRSRNTILLNPTHLGNGLGGLRNMTNHGPDKETGIPWKFTEEAVFGVSLLVFRYLRSVYMFHNKRIQEI